MNNFKIGDRVKWFDGDHTAIVVSTRDNGHLTVDFDNGHKGCGSLDKNFVLLYPINYEDFIDKIKDRLNDRSRKNENH